MHGSRIRGGTENLIPPVLIFNESLRVGRITFPPNSDGCIVLSDCKRLQAGSLSKMIWFGVSFFSHKYFHSSNHLISMFLCFGLCEFCLPLNPYVQKSELWIWELWLCLQKQSNGLNQHLPWQNQLPHTTIDGFTVLFSSVMFKKSIVYYMLVPQVLLEKTPVCQIQFFKNQKKQKTEHTCDIRRDKLEMWFLASWLLIKCSNPCSGGIHVHI